MLSDDKSCTIAATSAFDTSNGAKILREGYMRSAARRECQTTTTTQLRQKCRLVPTTGFQYCSSNSSSSASPCSNKQQR